MLISLQNIFSHFNRPIEFERLNSVSGSLIFCGMFISLILKVFDEIKDVIFCKTTHLMVIVKLLMSKFIVIIVRENFSALRTMLVTFPLFEWCTF